MEQSITINGNTKISELIKANKACIDVIAGLAKPFHRLRNPILRKVMASRVTINEAAKMGGCTIQDFAAALAPLGFRYEAAAIKENEAKPKPGWLLQADTAGIKYLDVRPVIESGTDPLKEILSNFKDVAAGGILCVINSFIPTPLIHLLEQEKADSSYVETVGPNEFHTYFLKKIKERTEPKEERRNVIMDDTESFDAVHKRFSTAQVKEIDVRHMEMPGPMQTILQELGHLPENGMLYVHHKRVPVYLLEELADKNYEVHILHIDERNVKMILFEKR